MIGYSNDQRVHSQCMRTLRNVTYSSDGRTALVKDRSAINTILTSFKSFPTSAGNSICTLFFVTRPLTRIRYTI
jgi:hypothetical protein